MAVGGAGVANGAPPGPAAPTPAQLAQLAVAEGRLVAELRELIVSLAAGADSLTGAGMLSDAGLMLAARQALRVLATKAFGPGWATPQPPQLPDGNAAPPAPADPAGSE